MIVVTEHYLSERAFRVYVSSSSPVIIDAAKLKTHVIISNTAVKNSFAMLARARADPQKAETNIQKDLMDWTCMKTIKPTQRSKKHSIILNPIAC